jgi:dienelactone hydrolase
MAEVVLFHHVQGLTEGIRGFADDLRAAGHTLHTPDLFEGALPATLEEGIDLTRRIGDEVLAERAAAAVADLPWPSCSAAGPTG